MESSIVTMTKMLMTESNVFFMANSSFHNFNLYTVDKSGWRMLFFLVYRILSTLSTFYQHLTLKVFTPSYLTINNFIYIYQQKNIGFLQFHPQKNHPYAMRLLIAVLLYLYLLNLEARHLVYSLCVLLHQKYAD